MLTLYSSFILVGKGLALNAYLIEFAIPNQSLNYIDKKFYIATKQNSDLTFFDEIIIDLLFENLNAFLKILFTPFENTCKSLQNQSNERKKIIKR